MCIRCIVTYFHASTVNRQVFLNVVKNKPKSFITVPQVYTALCCHTFNIQNLFVTSDIT